MCFSNTKHNDDNAIVAKNGSRICAIHDGSDGKCEMFPLFAQTVVAGEIRVQRG